MDASTLLAIVPTSFLPYVTGAIAVAAAIATLLPPPKMPASGVYPVIYGAVNWIALNLGHAKNVGAPSPSPTQGVTQ